MLLATAVNALATFVSYRTLRAVNGRPKPLVGKQGQRKDK